MRFPGIMGVEFQLNIFSGVNRLVNFLIVITDNRIIPHRNSAATQLFMEGESVHKQGGCYA